MSQQKNFTLLVLIMAATSLIVGAISIISLYHTTFEQHRLRLLETVKNQARMIESIASYNAFRNGNNIPEDWQDLTIQQIRNAHQQFEGFGLTGEYALARQSGDSIEFLMTHRHNTLESRFKIPYQGDWAQPMRLALDGQSGSIIGLDYRGNAVLAAFEPVAILDLGLTAKIDLAEIRAPFINTALISLAIGFVIILIASRHFLKIARPIAQQIEQQAETFRTLAETAQEGIVLINTRGIIQYVNPSAEAMFGFTRDSLPGQSVNRLMSRPMRERHDQYIRNYLDTGIAKIIGSGRRLLGQRRDGSQFPVYLSVGDINLKHTRLFAGVILDLSDQQRMQREIMEVPVREQRRIGQELHDGIGQQLTGLGMLAASLVNKASKPEFQLAKQLAEGLQETLSQVRALSKGLVPTEIDADGFKQALHNLSREISRQSHVPVSLSIHDDLEFTDNDLVMHLYRITQEALNNAIKHAEAGEIQINIGIENEFCLLEVFDNGKGIEDNREDFDGLGLSIMKYRCSLFDGNISVAADKKGGTRVQCRFPLNLAMRII